jgi:arylsulfatase A-like enzyme
VEPVRDANATHRPYGIFAVYAPGVVRSGARLDMVHIQDVAPTILHLMGEAVPRELEGQVLEAGITDSYSVVHPVQISEEPTIGPATDQELSSSELEIVLERLHDLGYIV